MVSIKVRDKNKMPSFIRHLRLALVQGLDDIGKETLSRIDSGFESGQDALGRSWQPLSPETIAQKGDNTILVDTGAMRQSYSHRVDSGRLDLHIGTDVPYAIFHEFGTERMPARPVLIPAAIYAEKYILPKVFDQAIDRAQRRSGARGGISTYL